MNKLIKFGKRIEAQSLMGLWPLARKPTGGPPIWLSRAVPPLIPAWARGPAANGWAADPAHGGSHPPRCL